jgi:hypothetical protein
MSTTAAPDRFTALPDEHALQATVVASAATQTLMMLLPRPPGPRPAAAACRPAVSPRRVAARVAEVDLVVAATGAVACFRDGLVQCRDRRRFGGVRPMCSS